MTNIPHKYFYDVIADTAERMPEKVTFRKRSGREFPGRPYGELKEMVDHMTAGLIKAGVEMGDRITFLCDASPNWLITDISIVTSGAVCVPRGTDVTDEDIIYIVTHSESKFAIVQREKDRTRLKNLKSKLGGTLKQIFVMEEDDGNLKSGEDTISELMAQGQVVLKKNPATVQEKLDQTDPGALATLIYTSGTTGAPKGVMLNQTGWLHAVDRVLERVGFRESDRVVSLLPPWHAFERAVEYGIAKVGIDFLVSDSIKLRDDLRDFKPTVFPSVPRIWESVYNGIISKIHKESSAKQGVFNFFLAVGGLWARKKAILFNYDPQINKPFFLFSFLRRLGAFFVLMFISPLKLVAMRVFHPIHMAMGGHVRISVSGGSALPGVVDKFLSAIGITVLEGYGMTETSAVISIRMQNRPTGGTVGIPLPSYEIKIKDDKGNDVTSQPGKKGSLWVKSDQILTGYYKRPELNSVIFDKDGFFDTGDIMMLSWRRELMFAGRAKDTIALAGGENVEPVPIEDKLLTSNYIDQVMVVGDDKKTLGALIVPNYEKVRTDLPEAPDDYNLWNFDKSIRDLYKKEITSLISKENGFKAFEMVPGSCFYISPRPFDLDTEMTRTLKMKRPTIKDNFKEQIEGMYR